jgi:hypothetical protein
VAVGSDGTTILTSPDGITWTERTSGTSDNDLRGVAYENGTFVAVGASGTILTSSDGTTWTSRTSGTNATLQGVTYANSTFVVVGRSGTIRTSSDGTTWTSRTSGTSNILWEVTNTDNVLELELMGGSFQGNELSLSNAVTTLAGTGSLGSSNGTGTSASFNAPTGITTDQTSLYVADQVNHLIRQIVISTGVVTTIAGTGSLGSSNGTGTSASFNKPNGITTDGINLYVTDEVNHLIRQIVISTGVVTTIAGTGSSGASNGTGTSASFSSPVGITTDGINLYVADFGNDLIRQIVISTGVVTTLAGTGSSGSSNGTGTSASFYYPTGITTDGTNLYVADQFNHLIRQIVISTGVVTTLAGTGSSGSSNGTGTSASFNGPLGITSDGTNLYVSTVNHLIRQIVISTGVVTTIAGTGSLGSSNGTGTSASFNFVFDITTDGKNLYVVDMNNHLIRQIE